MKIEEITQENIANLPNKELHDIRLRLGQLFSSIMNKESLIKRKQKLLTNYFYLVKEMEKRGMSFNWTSKIDKAIFKAGMYGIDSMQFKEIVLKNNAVSIAGKYAEDPKHCNEPVKFVTGGVYLTDEEKKDITSSLKSESEVEFIDEETVTKTGNYIPLFDLVLKPKDILERIEYKEDPVEISKNFFSVPQLSKKSKHKAFSVIRKEEERGLVGGIVYRSVEPNAKEKEVDEVVDSDNEYTTREELEKAAYGWMIRHQQIFHQHNAYKGRMPVHVVENFITDEDTVKDGEEIPANSWFLMCQVDLTCKEGKELWKKIKDGDIQGWSLGGYGYAEEEEEEEE